VNQDEIEYIKGKALEKGYRFVFNPSGSSTHIMSIEEKQVGCTTKYKPDLWIEATLPLLTCVGCIRFCDKRDIPYGVRAQKNRRDK
jgi:hypothetical protein